jgi:hypothetical protein
LSLHRYLAVTAFAAGCPSLSEASINIIAASSDASLQHLRFQLKSRRCAQPDQDPLALF